MNFELSFLSLLKIVRNYDPRNHCHFYISAAALKVFQNQKFTKHKLHTVYSNINLHFRCVIPCVLQICVNSTRQVNSFYIKKSQVSKMVTILYVLTIYWKKAHAFFDVVLIYFIVLTICWPILTSRLRRFFTVKQIYSETSLKFLFACTSLLFININF